jgi:aconitate hydratase
VVTGAQHLTIAKIARDYKAKKICSIVIGDQNYGEGSSREHAAMSPRYLGVKVVLARSFARIHETNLKKQGIIPLVFSNAADWELVESSDRVDVIGLSGLDRNKPVEVVLHKQDGRTVTILANHTLTEEQVKWFRAGSALNALSDK